MARRDSTNGRRTPRTFLIRTLTATGGVEGEVGIGHTVLYLNIMSWVSILRVLPCNPRVREEPEYYPLKNNAMLIKNIKILTKKPLNLIRPKRKPSFHYNSDSAYHAAILGLLANKKRISVVVVGANDGRINDPVYNLIRSLIYDRTDLILIEPNRQLTPYIEENYSFLNTKQILNYAIGDQRCDISLFTINENVWRDCQPSYAERQGWPIYRAPTGVSSVRRDFVEKWLEKHLSNKNEIDECISILKVPCLPLDECLSMAGHRDYVDVLQIDVEGADGTVVLSSISHDFRPHIVYFEYSNLPSTLLQKVKAHLHELDYHIIENKQDWLCVRWR